MNGHVPHGAPRNGVAPAPRPTRRRERPVLITGGAGFIGTNLAERLLEQGRRVIVLDNLARPGVRRNLAWLGERHGDRLEVRVGDVRDARAVRDAVGRAAGVYHFAAQVAVTTSLVQPLLDFQVNALGTIHVLEAARALTFPPPLLFTSTNKVYGELADVPLRRDRMRYAPAAPEHARGLGEDRPLDFHSPYGCSKGSADQYVLDYARCFDLPATVFRMSCIYGRHQQGNEDQGWVAHFALRALAGQPITVYGSGRQVRDVLYADDLADALLLAHERIDAVKGRAFNLGGGPDRTLSLLELLEILERRTGARPRTRFGAWRTGDQRWYVSDTSAFERATGWRPRVALEDGIERLLRWLRDGAATPRPVAVGKLP